jgi:hypothetical protein
LIRLLCQDALQRVLPGQFYRLERGDEEKEKGSELLGFQNEEGKVSWESRTKPLVPVYTLDTK